MLCEKNLSSYSVYHAAKAFNKCPNRF